MRKADDINYGGQEMAKYVVLYEDERKDALAPDLLKGHVEHLRDLHSQGDFIFVWTFKKQRRQGLADI